MKKLKLKPRKPKMVKVELPAGVHDCIRSRAENIGVPIGAVIKIWLHERALKEMRSAK